jgi:hypothetical protein
MADDNNTGVGKRLGWSSSVAQTDLVAPSDVTADQDIHDAHGKVIIPKGGIITHAGDILVHKGDIIVTPPPEAAAEINHFGQLNPAPQPPDPNNPLNLVTGGEHTPPGEWNDSMGAFSTGAFVVPACHKNDIGWNDMIDGRHDAKADFFGLAAIAHATPLTPARDVDEIALQQKLGGQGVCPKDGQALGNPPPAAGMGGPPTVGMGPSDAPYSSQQPPATSAPTAPIVPSPPQGLPPHAADAARDLADYCRRAMTGPLPPLDPRLAQCPPGGAHGSAEPFRMR